MTFRTLLVLFVLLGSSPGDAQAQDKLPTAPEVDLGLMVEIPGATFSMGVELVEPSSYGDSWFIDQTPAHDVTLDTFYLDPHEVTAEQFAWFLSHAAGEYHFHPDQPIERLHVGYVAIENAEQVPVHHVTWKAAHHYCLWAGKRLPTEAEYERAAAGTEGRTYPWEGDDGPSCSRVNYFTGATYCQDGPVDVGHHPDGATPEGVHDLAGNVAEWTVDWYGDYGSDAQTNPTGPESGTLQVVRGGGFLEWSHALRTHTRRGVAPGARSRNIGFRCAWSEESTDGALRGDLAPPEELERAPTDHPLVSPIDPPEVLLGDFTQPTDVVWVGGTWFVLDEGEGTVYRMAGGAFTPKIAIEGLLDPGGLIVDASYAYVTDTEAGELWRIDPDGDSTLLSDALDSPTQAVADGVVFVATAGGIVSVDQAGGIQLLVEVQDVVDMALSPIHVLWACDEGISGDDEVGQVPREGGEAEVLYDGFTSSAQPSGVAYDPDDGTVYLFSQRSSWPSSVEICQIPDGLTEAFCFAHAPPKSTNPTVFDGALYWTSQYTVVRLDPSQEAYEEVGTWANAKGLWVNADGVVWTDSSTGRLLRGSM